MPKCLWVLIQHGIKCNKPVFNKCHQMQWDIAWQMAGFFLKPGCLKPGLCFPLVLDVCFGCLSGILGFLKPGMRADLSIYWFLGVIQICLWVMYGLLCVCVDCVFGSCGGSTHQCHCRPSAYLCVGRGCVGRFPDADNLGPVASFILVYGSGVLATLRFGARLEVMADILLDPTKIRCVSQWLNWTELKM